MTKLKRFRQHIWKMVVDTWQDFRGLPTPLETGLFFIKLQYFILGMFFFSAITAGVLYKKTGNFEPINVKFVLIFFGFYLVSSFFAYYWRRTTMPRIKRR